MTETIVVLVRRIPDPGRLQMERGTGRLLTEGVPFILNPVDRAALEVALRLKEQADHKVVALTADEEAAEFELREALAMGADEAILLADPAWANQSDPTLHANLFKHAIDRIVSPDLVVAASRSMDHSWSTVGPQLAALLNWGLVIEAEDVKLVEHEIRAVAHTGAVRAKVTARLPCVITVARGVIEPRHATSWGVTQAFDSKTVDVKGLSELGLEADQVEGLKPRTQTLRTHLERNDRAHTTWEGSTEEVGRILARRLADLGYAGRRS